MQSDSAKASIASLEKNTEVIAHIAEKPQVTVAAPVNGTVEVAGTRGIQNVVLTGAEGEKRSCEYEQHGSNHGNTKRRLFRAENHGYG